MFPLAVHSATFKAARCGGPLRWHRHLSVDSESFRYHMRHISLFAFAIALSTTAEASPTRIVPGDEIVGRWDLVVQSGDTVYPSWLEVRRSGFRALVGSFVSRSGSARPVSNIAITNNTLRFSLPPQWERGEQDLVIEGTFTTDKMTGWMTDALGARQTWTATRAPSLVRAAAPVWGRPIAIFNGTDLTGWTPSDPNNQWQVISGVLTNTRSGANLITQRNFTDFKLHVEFRVPAKGNSGIYLRGRHEVQIEDSKGMPPGSLNAGGLYGFLTPNENAALAPGEWQTYDITLVGRMITVVLNGKTVISRQVIPGITGGALDSDEGAPGPLMLQGDHTSVEYRRIVLTPVR
jgi:Domain of Unknown Function (DUF1080)